MTGSRAVASCCLSCLLIPAMCYAQSRLTAADRSGAANLGPTVSVRELRIPEKARKAFRKGMERLAAQDWAGSIPEFQKAIKAFSDLYEAYYKIGIAQLELQQTPEAEAAFRKAIELSEGRYAPPLFGLALALCNQGQYPEAEVAVRTGLDLEPMDAAGHFTLAWVLYTGEKIVEAEKSALDAVRYDPHFATAHLLLAQIHRKQNNQAAFVADLDNYLRLEPNGLRSAGVRLVRERAQTLLPQQPQVAEMARVNR
jgi:tetratricopeptide (TPR) repeat protein